GAKAQAGLKSSDAALKRRSSTARGGGGKKKTSAAKAGRGSASRGTTEVVPFPITVEDPELCPRFSARAIRGTEIKASPGKIAHRLTLLDHGANLNQCVR